MHDELFSVSGQVVLLSGASRGIGRALAKGFAERGAHVIITGRAESTLEKAARDMDPAGKTVRPMVCDVADSAAIDRLVHDVVREFGQVDTLVNVAGVNRRMPAERLKRDPMERGNDAATERQGGNHHGRGERHRPGGVAPICIGGCRRRGRRRRGRRRA